MSWRKAPIYPTEVVELIYSFQQPLFILLRGIDEFQLGVLVSFIRKLTQVCIAFRSQTEKAGVLLTNLQEVLKAESFQTCKSCCNKQHIFAYFGQIQKEKFRCEFNIKTRPNEMDKKTWGQGKISFCSSVPLLYLK